MEFFNLILLIIIFFNFVNINSYKWFKEKVLIITDNAAKLDAKNEQSENTNAIKAIKTVLGNPKVFLTQFKKYPEYKKMADILVEMKVSLSLLAGEQYAMDKTISETNKAPHELNIVQVGKLEYSIKDKGLTLSKKTDIFDRQIQTSWAVIIICILIIVFINYFRDRIA